MAALDRTQNASHRSPVEGRLLDYLTLDVFTERPFAGNQLAVFTHAGGLDTKLMQAIAAELNLSETGFVTDIDADGLGYDLRIFTPTMELPFAGHPTIGSSVALATLGLISCDEEVRVTCRETAGAIPLEIARTTAGFAATLVSPQIPRRLRTDLAAKDAAALLSLSEASIAPPGPQAYTAGVGFMIVPVANRVDLHAARIDLQLWSDLLESTDCPHVYVFNRSREDPSSLGARMFAPLMGIAEDPATGAAAAALAGLLADHHRPPDGEAAWTIEQGAQMGRPSLIELRGHISNGTLCQVRVGGSAIVTGRGRLCETMLQSRSSEFPEREAAGC